MKSLLLVGMLCILLAGFIGMVCADEVEDIVSGHAHNCVLFKSKQVKCFGYNGYGQLGYEDKIPRGNDPGEMGDNLPYVQLSSDNSTYVEKIFSGSDSVCALFNDKRVKCWGYNEEGQLGYGDTESRGNEVDEMNDFLPFVDYGTGKKVLQIIMGYEHICVLRDDGKVVCTGCNCAGALGTETPEDVGDELNDIGDNLVPVNFGTGVTVSSIHSGPTAIHSCAILNESNLKCWGNNEFAQLGTGDTKVRGNALGQMGDKLKFVNLGKKAVLKAVSVGGTHTCVLLGDTSTRCWGLNVFGQIMTGSKSKYIGAKPKDMGKGLKPAVWGKKLYATTLFLEYASTCGLLNDGTVKCFGANDSGQLGQEDRNMRGKTKKTLGDKTKPINFGTNSTLIKLSNGYQFSCVLFVDKKFKCWGNGYGGALGYGDEMERGSFPNSMGSYLPYVDL